MLKQLRQDALQIHFENQRTLTRQDLWEYYTQKLLTGDETGFFWFLFELLQEGVLYKIDKDTYKLVVKTNKLLPYKPYLDDDFCKLGFELQDYYQRYGLYHQCIWSSAWFHEFMIHQPTRPLTIVEVEKEATTTVFHYLKEIGYKDVFVILYKKEAEALLENYILEAEKPIIVTKMFSDVRLIKQTVNKDAQKGISVPRLGKLLVDLYFDDTLLLAYKGAEQDNIFRNAINKYELNFRAMFAYASRRSEKKAVQMKAYLAQNFQEEIQRIVL